MIYLMRQDCEQPRLVLLRMQPLLTQAQQFQKNMEVLGVAEMMMEAKSTLMFEWQCTLKTKGTLAGMWSESSVSEEVLRSQKLHTCPSGR